VRAGTDMDYHIGTPNREQEIWNNFTHLETRKIYG
jgi:hypothetical protein